MADRQASRVKTESLFLSRLVFSNCPALGFPQGRTTSSCTTRDSALQFDPGSGAGPIRTQKQARYGVPRRSPVALRRSRVETSSEQNSEETCCCYVYILLPWTRILMCIPFFAADLRRCGPILWGPHSHSIAMLVSLWHWLWRCTVRACPGRGHGQG